MAAVGRLVLDTAVPDYGMFGGPHVGYPGRSADSIMNNTDANSYQHDRDWLRIPGASTAWVHGNWQPVPTNQVAPGPLGIAYVLAGTIPFLIDGHFH